MSFTKYIGKPVDPQKIETYDCRSPGHLGRTRASAITWSTRKARPVCWCGLGIKDYGPPFLNVGLTLSSNDSNDIQLGLGGRATFFGLVGPGSEVRTERIDWAGGGNYWRALQAVG